MGACVFYHTIQSIHSKSDQAHKQTSCDENEPKAKFEAKIEEQSFCEAKLKCDGAILANAKDEAIPETEKNKPLRAMIFFA